MRLDALRFVESAFAFIVAAVDDDDAEETLAEKRARGPVGVTTDLSTYAEVLKPGVGRNCSASVKVAGSCFADNDDVALFEELN